MIRRCLVCNKRIKGRTLSLYCEQCRIAKYYQPQKNGKEKENSPKKEIKSPLY